MGLASACLQPETGALPGLRSRPGLATVTASLPVCREVASVETWVRSSAGPGLWRTATQSSQEPKQSHVGRQQGKKHAPLCRGSPTVFPITSSALPSAPASRRAAPQCQGLRCPTLLGSSTTCSLPAVLSAFGSPALQPTRSPGTDSSERSVAHGMHLPKPEASSLLSPRAAYPCVRGSSHWVVRVLWFT